MENKIVPGSQHDAGVVLGALLIIAGIAYLLASYAPFDLTQYGWPLFVILPGLALIVVAVTVRSAVGLAVPGAIVTVVGLILAVQNTFDLWAAWTYAWALVFPGAVGVGTAIMGAVRHDPGQVDGGTRAALSGLGICAVFGLFFEGILHVSGLTVGSGLSVALPVCVIAIGFVLLLAAMFMPRRAR